MGTSRLRITFSLTIEKRSFLESSHAGTFRTVDTTHLVYEGVTVLICAFSHVEYVKSDPTITPTFRIMLRPVHANFGAACGQFVILKLSPTRRVPFSVDRLPLADPFHRGCRGFNLGTYPALNNASYEEEITGSLKVTFTGAVGGKD